MRTYTVYDLKPKFQDLLRPMVNMLARTGITANQVTIAGCAISIIQGCLILTFPDSRGVMWLLPIVLFVRMALNAMDGLLAKEHGMKSKLGVILNELADVVSDLAIFLPFCRVPGFQPRWVIAFSILAILTEFVGVVAVQMGASRRYDGPMGKSDRTAAFGFFAILIGSGVPIRGWISIAVLGLNAALLYTIYNRISKALREVNA